MKQYLKFIGKVHSELKRLEDCPLLEHENAPEATIEIFKAFHDAVKNVKPGDDMIILTWLHEADRTILTTRPRNNLNAAMTGVFSTRSPDRPNPVGIHFVKIVSIPETNKFKISGLEVLDGTPLIDIKPDLR